MTVILPEAYHAQKALEENLRRFRDFMDEILEKAIKNGDYPDPAKYDVSTGEILAAG